MPLSYNRQDNNSGNGAMPRNNSSFELDGVEYREDTQSNRQGSGTQGSVRPFRSSSSTATYFVKSPLKTPYGGSYYLPQYALLLAQTELRYYEVVYPHLNVLLDCSQDGDYRLVMPDLGTTFISYAQASASSPIEFKALTLAAFRELSRIHSLGIVHRDLVDGNVMVLSGNRVHFIDGSYSSTSADLDEITDVLRARRSDIMGLVEIIEKASAKLFGINIFPQLSGYFVRRKLADFRIEDIVQLLETELLSNMLSLVDPPRNSAVAFRPNILRQGLAFAGSVTSMVFFSCTTTTRELIQSRVEPPVAASRTSQRTATVVARP